MKGISGIEILDKKELPKTTIKEMRKRKLTYGEKCVISFLDASENRDRSAHYEVYLEENEDGNITLQTINRILVCHPSTLLSLSGKGLIKLRYGRLSLLGAVYKRSIRALQKDGYFEDIEFLKMGTVRE